MNLLAFFHDRLRYLAPTTLGLVESAGAMEQLGGIPWLAQCRGFMAEGVPFPKAWKDALAQSPGSLNKGELELLSPLSEVLGATDLESQLNAVACARAQMELRLAAARDYRDKHHRLYSSLGVLGGVAIVIILL